MLYYGRYSYMFSSEEEVENWFIYSFIPRLVLTMFLLVHIQAWKKRQEWGSSVAAKNLSLLGISAWREEATFL